MSPDSIARAACAREALRAFWLRTDTAFELDDPTRPASRESFPVVRRPSSEVRLTVPGAPPPLSSLAAQERVARLREVLGRKLAMRFGPLSDEAEARIAAASADELVRSLDRVLEAGAPEGALGIKRSARRG